AQGLARRVPESILIFFPGRVRIEVLQVRIDAPLGGAPLQGRRNTGSLALDCQLTIAHTPRRIDGLAGHQVRAGIVLAHTDGVALAPELRIRERGEEPQVTDSSVPTVAEQQGGSWPGAFRE